MHRRPPGEGTISQSHVVLAVAGHLHRTGRQRTQQRHRPVALGSVQRREPRRPVGIGDRHEQLGTDPEVDDLPVLKEPDPVRRHELIGRGHRT